MKPFSSEWGGRKGLEFNKTRQGGKRDETFSRKAESRLRRNLYGQKNERERQRTEPEAAQGEYATGELAVDIRQNEPNGRGASNRQRWREKRSTKVSRLHFDIEGCFLGNCSHTCQKKTKEITEGGPKGSSRGDATPWNQEAEGLLQLEG